MLLADNAAFDPLPWMFLVLRISKGLSTFRRKVVVSPLPSNSFFDRSPRRKSTPTASATEELIVWAAIRTLILCFV